MIRNWVAWLSAVTLLALLPFGVDARSDGNALLQRCSSAVKMGDRPNDVNDTDLIQAGFCLGLVQGVSNTNRIYQSMVGNRALFCTPDSFINNQGVRIVAKYLYEHPEKLHMNDTLLVIMALEDAFPCPRN